MPLSRKNEGIIRIAREEEKEDTPRIGRMPVSVADRSERKQGKLEPEAAARPAGLESPPTLLGRGLFAATALPSRRRFRSGVPALDRLLGGGLPEGRLILLQGAPSSGRTTLALRIAGEATSRPRGVVCWIDPAAALDAVSAVRLGVDLSRLIVVRPADERGELRAAFVAAASEETALVVLDRSSKRGAPLAPADAARLEGAARRSGSSVLVLAAAFAGGERGVEPGRAAVRLAVTSPRTPAIVPDLVSPAAALGTSEEIGKGSTTAEFAARDRDWRRNGLLRVDRAPGGPAGGSMSLALGAPESRVSLVAGSRDRGARPDGP